MIIGISGKKQHGKDTVAKLINYWTTGGPETYESLEGFLEYYDDAHRPHGPGYPWEIVRFADKLKDVVCIVLGCTREQLEDNNYKNTKLGEEWRVWYIYSEGLKRRGYNGNGRVSPLFITKEECMEAYNKVKYDFFVEVDTYVLTPRLMLQYFGTDCGRNIIHPNIWVNATMGNYKPTVLQPKQPIMPYGLFYMTQMDYELGIGKDNLFEKGDPRYYDLVYPNWIIPDVRFPNEYWKIDEKGGIIARVERPEIISTDLHPSETSLDGWPFEIILDNIQYEGYEKSLYYLSAQVKTFLINNKIIKDE